MEPSDGPLAYYLAYFLPKMQQILIKWTTGRGRITHTPYIRHLLYELESLSTGAKDK